MAATAWGRRWRDLCLAHANDLGGADNLSEAQVSIIKRTSAMECELEAMEARLSAGQSVDLELYGRLTSLLCRALALVGIPRHSPPLDPTSALAEKRRIPIGHEPSISAARNMPFAASL